MKELPQATHEAITRSSEEGDLLAKRGSYNEAVACYNQAWKLVPEPKSDWEASTWLLAAIGDACFLGGFYKSGYEALSYALLCPNGLGNPFIHLRLGQCEYERGNFAEAAEQLTRAYALEGAQLFRLDDPKYFVFLKTKIEAPALGW